MRVVMTTIYNRRGIDHIWEPHTSKPEFARSLCGVYAKYTDLANDGIYTCKRCRAVSAKNPEPPSQDSVSEEK